VVFDNVSNYENSVGGAAIAYTISIPNTFMGDGYTLSPGTTAITGFDIFPVNGPNQLYRPQITIYVWQNVNTGTVNAGNPAFSSLLATYTLTSSGAFDTNHYFKFEGSPAGSAPGLTLGTPLAISGTDIGITFNYQGTTTV